MAPAVRPSTVHLQGALYLAFNIATGVTIVLLNKTVFSVLGFKFVSALALIHAILTVLGMQLFCWFKFFERKALPAKHTAPLALAFVGYVAGWNWSLQINPVGFYQLSKVMITPVIAAIEYVYYGKTLTKKELAAIFILCIGIALATVTDSSIAGNVVGLVVGAGAICFTAMYQIWCGTKQKELHASSMQLMDQYAPWSVLFLAMLVPAAEPLGWDTRSPDTLLGYPFDLVNISVIASTAVLGLLVTWSTLLAISATGPLTFAVVTHLKLIIIVVGGMICFNEQMPMERFAGIVLALTGIGWYSWSRLENNGKAQKQQKAGSTAIKPMSDKALMEPLVPMKHARHVDEETGEDDQQIKALSR